MRRPYTSRCWAGSGLRPGARGWLVGLVVVCAWLVPERAGWALDVSTASYQAAAAGGHVGVVAGRAVEEARRRGAPATPLSGFSVTLMPYSAEFLARLRDIADRGRRDLTAHARTASAIVEARREYERALAGAGAAELVMSSPVAPDGRFEVMNVPAGEWLVIALHPVFVASASPATKSRDKETFAPQARISGYYAVAVWVRAVSVVPGEETSVALTDRNVMMTAVEEKPAPGAGR